MPELPEVESIKLQLERFLKGHKVESVDARNRRIFQGDEAEIIGAKFIAARRFGKVLVLDLDNKKSLAIHVKMTGQLIYRGKNLPNPPKLSSKVTGGLPGSYTQVIFNLDKASKLYFNDFRRFGWIKILITRNLEKQDSLLGKLGPEPFKDLTLEYFKEQLGKTRRAIKVQLMDQAKIAGVGNIYANDALFLAMISPSRPANSLTDEESEKLFNAIHEVLRNGMKYGGSSENTFVTPDGTEGLYQRHTLVYAKQGQACVSCKKEKIKKIQLGGRGTFYCEACQK
ncbi:bifunctional DNA-formamidopyrimidine glycosylase/DNA-(apurinic or apyrimidinic site) lyase [Candidatus Microgenomates bacterium]|nr:MAG: bifunctional DNA-formamidopyrimidine glycosylase/DNA-(apurinic or apyrimidinic site) lyase [Candidatus Microgenomates bacterium]